MVGLVNNSSSGIPEDHRSLRAYLTTLSLDTVEDVMVGEVDEREEDVGWSISCLASEEDVVDKPRTIIATCFYLW